jgi:glutamine amidotransferase
MCRLLGVMCNDEDLLGCAVHEVKESLKVGSGERHDGIGVGYYRNDDPLLKKRPSATIREIEYDDLVEGIASNVLMVHVRRGTVGAWKDVNSHPFRFRRWLFAALGHLPALVEKRDEILGRLPSFLARNVQGETDSELAFHLLLERLFSDGTLNDLGLAAEAMGKVLKETLVDIEALHASGKGSPSFACLVTNGQVMALACRRIQVHYSHREGILECARHDDSEQQRRLHRRFKGIMLGADMSDPGHQWREVADGSLLTISKGLELRVEGW